MPVKVTLKDTLTNKTAEYIDNYSIAATYEESFMWTEHNFSCDCNRYMFFYNDYENAQSLQCGKERFVVVGWEPLC